MLDDDEFGRYGITEISNDLIDGVGLMSDFVGEAETNLRESVESLDKAIELADSKRDIWEYF